MKETEICYYYYIDNEYHIIEMSQDLAELFPQVQPGEYCYHALVGLDEPCKGCKLISHDAGSRIMYNRLFGKYIEVHMVPMRSEDGGQSFLVNAQVIADTRHSFVEFMRNSAYDEIFEVTLPDGCVISRYMDERYYEHRMEGKTIDILSAAQAEFTVHPKDRERYLEFWDIPHMLMQIEQGDHVPRCFFRKRLTAGGWGWVTQVAIPVSDGRGNKSLLCITQDLQDSIQLAIEDVQSEEKVHKRNVLTGLYRKNTFIRKVQEQLGTVEDGEYCIALIDIEHFKLFNEFYGFKAGDRCLAFIGEILMNIAHNNNGIAGYATDDDFALFIPAKDELLHKIEATIRDYMASVEGSVGFFPAVGVYLIEDRTLSVNKMMDYAELAVAAVKGHFDKRIEWYDTSMLKDMEETHWMLHAFLDALKNEELQFYLQPKCSASTGKIVGVEALVRWEDKLRGFISPAEFIPILEKNGLIGKMDYYIWDKVFERMNWWRREGHELIPAAINLSRVDIYTMDVVKMLKELTAKYGLEHNLVEVEVTESAFEEDSRRVLRTIDQLREEGFIVSIDDFGSGYSSLNMLKDINVDILKIDMKFLELNEENRDKGINILETIYEMAAMDNLRVVAEGVEDEEQLKLLQRIGYEYVQGYYFYRPLPPEAYHKLAENENIIDGKDYLSEVSYKKKPNAPARMVRNEIIPSPESASKQSERQLTLNLEANNFVLKCTKLLHRTPDISRSLMQVLGEIGELLKAEHAYIVETDKITVNTTFEWCAPGVEPRKMELENYPYEKIAFWETMLEDNTSIIIEDVNGLTGMEAEQCQILRKVEVARMIAAPIYSSGKLEGYLGVDNYYTKIPVTYMQYILETMAYFITSELKNYRLMKKLEVLSYTDSLTQTHNRNAFMKAIRELKNGQSIRLGFIVMDINGLKNINDRHGHLEGDGVLVKAVEILADMVMPYKIYRVGGDEFVVVCPGITEESFEHLRDRVRISLLGQKHMHIAVGTAWGSDSHHYKEILRRADKMMYEDKKTFYRETGNSSRADFYQ